MDPLNAEVKTTMISTRYVIVFDNSEIQTKFRTSSTSHTNKYHHKLLTSNNIG